MSELTAYHCNEWHNEYTEFYLKSEADKVIAEKDEEIERLNTEIREAVKTMKSLESEIVGLKKQVALLQQNYPRTRRIIMDEVAEAIEKYHGLVPLVYDIETMGLAEARPQDMYYAVYLKREADKVIAHNKYKRCLAMAKWCDTKGDWYYSLGESFRNRVDFYIKWRDKWLKIADKCKEAK